MSPRRGDGAKTVCKRQQQLESLILDLKAKGTDLNQRSEGGLCLDEKYYPVLLVSCIHTQDLKSSQTNCMPFCVQMSGLPYTMQLLKDCSTGVQSYFWYVTYLAQQFDCY